MINLGLGLLSSLTILSLCLWNASSLSLKSFDFTDSNKNATAHYLFSFSASQTYSNAQLVVTFPVEYSLSSFLDSIQCFSSEHGQVNQYSKSNCWVEPDNTSNGLFTLGSIVIQIPNVGPSRTTSVVIKNVKNPQTESSSFFQLCLRKGSVLLECNRNFAQTAFTNTIQQSTEIIFNNTPAIAIAGRGQSVTFNVKVNDDILSKTLGKNITIRLKMPNDFNSSRPLCSIAKTNSTNNWAIYTQMETSNFPTVPNEIYCHGITNLTEWVSDQGNFITIRLENMINPLSSGTYHGIYVEIIAQRPKNPIRKLFNNTLSIEVRPEPLGVEIRQTNLMRISTNPYFFFVNQPISLNRTYTLEIQFSQQQWNIHNGYVLGQFDNTSNVISQVIGNKAIFYVNETMRKNTQQIYALNLTSIQNQGEHQVSVRTIVNNGILAEWKGFVHLNSTIGTLKLFSASAVQAAVKLPVGKIGPLELTFFLNYELPKSDDITNGTMNLTIYPQLEQPDPDIQGAIKCYWKGTFQSEICTFDNSQPNKTKIRIESPHFTSFKYSQIPIILTTQGGINEQSLGFKISDLVQRYRFQIEFFLYNSSQIPSEVFYSTWIADAIEMQPALNTIVATSHENGTQTHIIIEMTLPSLQSNIDKEFRIMVQFKNAGITWALNAGYQTDKIYEEFPCVVLGFIAGTNTHCDLYTYLDPEKVYSNLHINNDFSGPFIMVYGFSQSNVTAGQNVTIHIPKIKLNEETTGDFVVGLSILEETPSEVEPYVQLYFVDVNVFSATNVSQIPYEDVSGVNTLVQSDVPFVFSFPVSYSINSQVRYIVYQFSTEIPSFVNRNDVCQSGNCASFGHPANWIVQTLETGTSTTHTLQLRSGFQIRTMNYVSDNQVNIPILIHLYNQTGRTIARYRYQNNYAPQTMAAFGFSFNDVNPVHRGLDQWYKIDWTMPDAETSDYPFIRFKIQNGLSFSQPPQCTSDTIVGFNQSGIICELQESNTIMRVKNIKKINPSSSYSMRVRMRTTSATQDTTPLNTLLSIYVNYAHSIDKSLVAIQQNKGLAIQPKLKGVNKFEIHNPQIINEDIQIGYIGPVYIKFDSTQRADVDLTIRFNDHEYGTDGKWTTHIQPVSPPTDTNPVVCILNGQRYDCILNSNINPLEITLKDVVLKTGVNNLKLDTEYVKPYNGIIYPNFAGFYLISMKVISESIVEKQATFYVEVSAPPFLHMQAESIVKDVNTQSVYKINFTTSDFPVKSYTQRSRIYVQFPTKIGSENVFHPTLRGYTGNFGERVGCYFKKGAGYIQPQSGKVLECRLIPSQIEGQPVRVQIINFQPLAVNTSVSVYIFKVFNPTDHFYSVPITVRINNVETNGNVLPLYKQAYYIFLDPRQPLLTQIQIDGEFNWQTGKFVGDQNASIRLSGQQAIGTDVTYDVSYFYLLVKLPSYLQPINDPAATTFFSECSFQQCVSVPEIQYILVKLTAGASGYFSPILKNLPFSTNQKDSIFQGYIVENGQYTGVVRYTITADTWKLIQGPIENLQCKIAGLTQKGYRDRKNLDVLVQFKTTHRVPETGTIQIGFPSSVSNVKAHCRSAIELNSQLISQQGYSGEIGCMVQNTNKLVITGFKELPAGSQVVIKTRIDVKQELGIGHVTTYADNDLFNIHINGSIIDHVKTDFGLNPVGYNAANINQDIFFTQRDVIRVLTTGEFRVIIQNVNPIGPDDTIQIKLWNQPIKNLGVDESRFTFQNKQLVCQFVRIDNNQKIGCLVTGQKSTESVLFSFSSAELLPPNIKYQIRLTTQSFVPPQGITYPKEPGTYKMETTVRLNGVISNVEHSYIEVYGPNFSKLKTTQHNYKMGEEDLFWIEFSPTRDILTHHQIIIQFPTRDLNGQKLFENNLGLTQNKDGQFIPFDIFDSDVSNEKTFMKCRLYYGDFDGGIPTKIICGQLQSILYSGNELKFAIQFINPLRTGTPSAQLSLPVIIYTFDPLLFIKTNFNFINAAIYVTGQANNLNANGHFSTLSGQLQVQNDILYFGDAHNHDLIVGDAYILKFAFPLRKNGMVTNGCINKDTNARYGHAYYHENLQTIVCKISEEIMTSQIQPQPSASRIALIQFSTPWYKLASSERNVKGFASYNRRSWSQTILYNSPSYQAFPQLEPRYSYPAPPATAVKSAILRIQTVSGSQIKCVRDDYIFKIQYSGISGESNIKYTKQISIHFPALGDLDIQALETDCIQHKDSQITVLRCDIDLGARTIYAQIAPGDYQDNQIIAIRTLRQAIKNPCLTPTLQNFKFVVRFYSWENVTPLTQRDSSYAYLIMNENNINTVSSTSTLTFVDDSLITAGVPVSPFEWIKIPHERTFSQFAQMKQGQYSPFSFEIFLSDDLPTTTNYHTLTLEYGPDYDAKDVNKFDDLAIYKPVCYLNNNRIRNCFLNKIEHKISMQFQFSLAKDTPIHVKFSVLNPRIPEENGFSWFSDHGDMSIVHVKLQDGANNNIKIFETMPFQARKPQTLPDYIRRGIVYAEIDYATAIQSKLNVLEMTFFVDTTEIKALQFEIPLMDQTRNLIFNVNQRSSFFNLLDGSEYPCGNNNPSETATGNPKCYIFNGDKTNMGIPTSITMYDIAYQDNKIIARIILNNPDVIGSWMSVRVKAYAGSSLNYSTFGNKYVGSWNFQNIFQVSQSDTTNSRTATSTSCMSPNKYLWRDQTQWTISACGQSLIQGSFVILQVLLSNENTTFSEKKYCATSFAKGNGLSDDMLILKQKNSLNSVKAFFIKKSKTSIWSWQLQYFKCKHYLNSFKIRYYPDKESLNEITNTVSVTFPQVSIIAPIINAIQKRSEIQIDLSPLVNSLLGNGFAFKDFQSYVLAIYVTPSTFIKTAQCFPTYGFLNTRGDYVKCQVQNSGTTPIILISNFQKIIGSSKIRVETIYTSELNVPSALYSPYTINVEFFANYDAFNTGTKHAMIKITQLTTTRYFEHLITRSGSCSFPTNTMTPVSYQNLLNTGNCDVQIVKFVPVGANSIEVEIIMKITNQVQMIYSSHPQNYPYIEIIFEGYDFSCATVTGRSVVFATSSSIYAGTPFSSPTMTCTNSGFIYNGRSNNNLPSTYYILYGGYEIRIKATLNGVPTPQRMHERDWIGVRTMLSVFSSRTCYSGNNYIHILENKIAAQGVLSSRNWASSFKLESQSLVRSEPTQLKITIINITLPLNIFDEQKMILVEFSDALTSDEPFDYIDPSKNNQEIECLCEKNNEGFQVGSTTLKIQGSICHLRKRPDTTFGSKIAITMQIKLNDGFRSFRCFFPGWLNDHNSYISAQAKVVNRGSGYTKKIAQPSSTYGSIYSQASNTGLPIPNTVSTNDLTSDQTIIENPNLAIVENTVNHPQGFYQITINISNQQTKPYFYFRFGQGRPKVDQTMCPTSQVSSCRIYNKWTQVVAIQFDNAFGKRIFVLQTSSTKFLPYKIPSASFTTYIFKKSQSQSRYSQKYRLQRGVEKFKPLQLPMSCQPDQITGTRTDNLRTNLVISFSLGNLSLYTDFPNNGRIQIQATGVALTQAANGCSASAKDNPDISFECNIVLGSIVITSLYRQVQQYVSFTKQLQIVIGIVNPSVPINWKLTSYHFVTVFQNGVQSQGQVTYTPQLIPATQVLQQRSRIRMYPFNSKILARNVNNESPLRIFFKLNQTITTVPIGYDAANYFVLAGLEFATGEKPLCFFREYQKVTGTSLFLSGSYNSMKHSTQFLTLYTHCSFDLSNNVMIQLPRMKQMTNQHYYELVVMPVGQNLVRAGFQNKQYNIKFLLMPNQYLYIDKWLKYQDTNIFSLVSIFYVTERFSESNSILIKFNIAQNLEGSYPDHFLQFHLRDFPMVLIKENYRKRGANIPCTLNSQFKNSSSVFPKCVINLMDAIHNDVVIRVVGLQDLNTGNEYKISIDDFNNPDMVAMTLEKTHPFSICIRYHNFQVITKRHQRCFDQLFLFDGLNTNAISNEDASFALPMPNNYKLSITGSISYTAGITTTGGQVHDKLVVRVSGGYSVTTSAPLTFNTNLIIWFNPQLNLYILSQNQNIVLGNDFTFTISNLKNPQPYLKALYENGNIINMVHYNNYQPVMRYEFDMPPFNYFVLSNQNFMSNNQATPLINDVTAQSVSLQTPIIITIIQRLEQQKSQLERKQISLLELTFTSGISIIEECWATIRQPPITNPEAYAYIGDGGCQVADLKKILLRNFYQSNVQSQRQIIIRAKVRISSPSIELVSKLYSTNGLEEYVSNPKQYSLSSKISTTAVKNTLLTFPENSYIPTYFEQIIKPVVIGSRIKYLYFVMSMPINLLSQVTTVTIRLNDTKQFFKPNTNPEQKLICQWLKTDLHNRKYHRGVFSHCYYDDVAKTIEVQSPLAGLLQLGSQGYLLKIRQLDIIETSFNSPTNYQPYEIIFEFENSDSTIYDTLVVQPYSPLNVAKVQQSTLEQNEQAIYFIEFTPPNVAQQNELVLELSIDSRYIPEDLGMAQVYQKYGVDHNNATRVDNLGLNLQYDVLTSHWLNGMPYTSHFTSQITSQVPTTIRPNSTTMHSGNRVQRVSSRVTLLNFGALSAQTYQWRIPLIKNPESSGKPLRMNLTVWQYKDTYSGIGARCLFYEIINHKKTKIANTISELEYTFINSAGNMIQKNNINMGVSFTSQTIDSDQQVLLKLDNNLVGVVGIPDFQANIQPSSYYYYFFGSLNLLLAVHHDSSDQLRQLPIGTAEISNKFAEYYGYEWINVYKDQHTVKKGGPLTSILAACLFSDPQLRVTQGVYNLKDSQFQMSLSFNTNQCFIPENSTLVIAFDENVMKPVLNSPCYTSFKHHSCLFFNGKIQIKFTTLIQNQVVTAKSYFKIIGDSSTETVVTAYVYGIPGVEYTKVFDASFLPIKIDITNEINKIVVLENNLILATKVEHIQHKYLYQGTRMELRGQISPTQNMCALKAFKIIHPFLSMVSSTPQFLIRENSTSPQNSQFNFNPSNNLNWLRAWVQTNPSMRVDSQTEYKVPLGHYDGSATACDHDYILQGNKSYTFVMETTYEDLGNNDYLIGSVGQFYQFQFSTQQSVYLPKHQIAHHQVYPVPVAQLLEIFNPYKSINKQTILGFKFTTNQVLPLGIRINVQLDSHNLRYNMFRLVEGYPVQCVENFVTPGPRVITDQSHIVCQVTSQPITSDPLKPIVISLYPKKQIASGTEVFFWVSSIYNGNTTSMVSGATLTVDKQCYGTDGNTYNIGKKRCVIYQARGYYRTNIQNEIQDNGTWTPNSDVNLAKGANHQFVLDSTGEYKSFIIRYPQNYENHMSESCTSDIGTCLIFPRRRQVVVVPTNPSLVLGSLSTFTLSGMNNGIYLQPTESNISVIGISSSELSSTTFTIPHNNLTTLKQYPISSLTSSNNFSITPTQTPNIFLRNYLNTVVMKIKGIYTTPFVKAFYINAPQDVVFWEQKYCNATLNDPLADPYPHRLRCGFINDTTLQILIPEYIRSQHQLYVQDQHEITVHAKFFIKDFEPGDGILYISQPQNSGTFNVYGSFSETSALYHYYITQASTIIEISQHRVPIVGQINFNTETFVDRRANINQDTTFQLLIQPITPVGQGKIARVEIVIDQNFSYPALSQLDQCQLVSTLTDHIDQCFLSRHEGKTILTVMMPPHYDNGVRILRLSSSQGTFKAPSQPGSWYNVQVLLYGEDTCDANGLCQGGVLLEAQTNANSSEIGGVDLLVPDIDVDNYLDEKENQIVDITFKIRDLPVPQGHTIGLSTGEYYSQIKVTFENVNAYDMALGLNLSNYQLVGCITSLQSFKQVECKLQIGYHIDDEPCIFISGYNPIEANSQISLSFSNILNLPSGVYSTISLSIILHRVGDSRQSFLYNPTEKTMKPTSAVSVSDPLKLNILYNDTLTLNLPTILNITLTPQSPSSPLSAVDTLVLKFPPYILNPDYSLFSPRNLLPSTECPLCSQFQVGVYYRGGTIQMKLRDEHQSGQKKYYIVMGMPTPVYAVDEVVTCTFEAFKNKKLVHKVNKDISVHVKPCALEFVLKSVSSRYISESDVIYELVLKLPVQVQSPLSNLSKQTDVAIKFENFTQDFRDLNINCSVLNGQCSVAGRNYLMIKGLQADGSQHNIKILGMSNPANKNVSVVGWTYINGDVEKVVCKSQIKIVLEEPLNFNCNFKTEASHISANAQNTYKFTIQCPNIIKNGTIANVRLPTNLAINNPQQVQCWSEPRSLLNSTNCEIGYRNGSYFLMTNKMSTDQNQKSLTMYATMMNPVLPGAYNFSSTLTYNDYRYASTSSKTLTVVSTTPTPINSPSLTNLPSSSGQPSYYILRIPSSSLNSTLQITFPPEFQLPRSVTVSQFVSNSSMWASQLNYDDVLTSNTNVLQSSVYTGGNLTQGITVDVTSAAGNAGTWTYLIIDQIVNPAYQSGQNFSINSYSNTTSNQKQLVSYFQGSLPYTLTPPGLIISHTDTQVSDNDAHTLANYTVTYQLSQGFITNRTALYIWPPLVENNQHLDSVKCCINHLTLSVNPFSFCDTCVIFNDAFKFSLPDGIELKPLQDIVITLSELWTPQNASACTTLFDHIISYFAIEIVRDGTTVLASTRQPTNMDSPCVEYRLIKADILGNFPPIVYAGMVHEFTITLSQPTKMLRVMLNTTSPWITFEPDRFYFSNFDSTQVTGRLIVSSTASQSQAYINITHDESGGYDIFRPNLPASINILTNHTEYVQVHEQAYPSIGYKIKVPITVTVPNSVNMVIQLTLSPNNTQLKLQTNRILIPAFASESSFVFWYEGTKIPETVNLSMSLSSAYPLYHVLRPKKLYFHFSTTSTSTSPPIMSIRILHDYRNNFMQIGRDVYHISLNNTVISQKIKPHILEVREQSIGSTSAHYTVYTTKQCQVVYVLYEYGQHFDKIPQNGDEIVSNLDAIVINSMPNSSFIINPYVNLTLTQLKSQTKYFVYMTAYNSLGVSTNVTTVAFETSVPSNAVRFALTLRNQVQKDEVKIVKTLGQIMGIDASRIKVVSSEKILEEGSQYDDNLNQRYYDHQIVISPSTTNDDIPPSVLLEERLFNNASAQARLKQLLPNWIGTFNPAQTHIETRRKPSLKSAPEPERISYYNATFSVQYWNPVKVHAILLQDPGQTKETLNYTQMDIRGVPIAERTDLITSSQVIRGVDEKNQKVFAKTVSQSSSDGVAKIFFDNLRPGSRYVMYVSATSPQGYEPIIYGEEVTRLQFYTLWNPNLHNEQKLVLQELKQIHPRMYEAITEFYRDARNKAVKGHSMRK